MDNRFRAREILSRLRVRSGLIAALAVLVLCRPSWTSIWIGLLISFLGLAVRAWAAGHLNKEKELAVSGPYRYSRNPLYLGNLIIGLGITAGSRSWWVAGVFAVYFALFYPLVIRRERDRMKELFAEQYENYRSRVPSFFPSLFRPRFPSRRKFNWQLYKKNKEYRALAGIVFFWVFLAVKILIID